MGNPIQRPKEQRSFDRKEGKAESTCVDERGSHPTSPYPQTSWASAPRVPHMERPYFQCIYRLCPNDWDPATPRWNHSFTSNEEDLHRSHPPSHGICVRSVERRTQRMSPTPTRLICKRHSLSLPPLEKRFAYHTLVLFYRVRANLAPTFLSPLVPPLTSTKSGYSFKKESYPVPLTKKICNVKQIFALCNHFMERPPSRGAVID